MYTLYLHRRKSKISFEGQRYQHQSISLQQSLQFAEEKIKDFFYRAKVQIYQHQGISLQQSLQFAREKSKISFIR